MLRNSLLFILSFCLISPVFSQESDSTALTEDAFLNMIKENHPMVLQAELLLERADAKRLKAAGSFDPKLFNETKQKYFDEKTYFRLQDAGVKIPTWFGLTAKAGYEVNDGYNLNPQNSVPANGLYYADLSLTLGKGLFIDERRATLKKAQLMQEAATYDIEWTLNKLYQDALNDYWEWYRSYTVYLLYDEGMKLAKQRFNIILLNALSGEEPFIDTLEAHIQYQSRLLSKQEAAIAFTQASRKLETHLWLDGLVPLELDSTTYPQFIEEPNLPELQEDWVQNHPMVKSYVNKIGQLGIEQRWNKEQLKPQVDLSYKFLNEPISGDPLFADYNIANYQWGLSASFPIFLRKERGAIQLTDVEIRDTEYDLTLKTRSLENTVLATVAEFNINRLRLDETSRMVNNYRILLQAEVTKFENGESSLFLINQREIKYLESSEKLLELQSKIKQTEAKLLSQAALLD